MKQKIYLILAGLFLLSLHLKAQTPNAINYQGVARNSSGSIIANQAISLRFTIHQTTATGTAVYQETWTDTTNEFGLFTVAIGNGAQVGSSTFASINWSKGPYYLEVEMDPQGGASYLDMGSNQLLSVPYALYAANAGSGGTTYTAGNGVSIKDSVISADTSAAVWNANKLQGDSISNTAPATGQVLQWNGTAWVPVTQTILTDSTLTGNGTATSELGIAQNGATTGQVLEWNGTEWTPTTPVAAPAGWNLTGNSGTTAGTDFVGTTDANDLVFETNGKESFRIANINGNVGIGTTTPAQPLDVVGNVQFSGALMPGSAAGTAGNILLSAGTGLAPTWLANGTPGTVLTISGGVPTWVTPTTSGTAWQLTGNSGTTYGANFIGTTDVSLMFRVGNQVAGRIETSSSTSSTSIGYEALNSNTASYNSALGYQALYSNITGIDNVALGYQSLYSNNTNGWYNVAVGYQDMMANTSGQWNVGIGAQTLLVNTTGQKNTAVGSTAMYENTTGNFDVAVGTNALNANVSGSNNTAVGYLALTANTANNNSAFGNQALYANTTGIDNTALGYNALLGNTTGSNNTALGYGSNVGSSALSNATAIGAQAYVTQSNSVVLGSISGVNGATATSNVGIGTDAPNQGAALDITSASQGLLIPRMTANPTAPALGMMYFNTSSGCFMFYNGTFWQSIACGCPTAPPALGSITGHTSFCTGTIDTFSVAAVSGAAGYTWTVPTGSTIIAGWGSNTIVVSFGNVGGDITVAANNSCGTGATSILAVTSNAPAITGQPTSQTTTTTGTVTFTVTATGATSYQWQVSTNGGSTWTAVSNTAPYSEATTATLTVTDPTSGMSGYEYECIVNGTCAATSNAATLTVSNITECVPITITNNQSAATTANFTAMISPLNFSTYASDGENANLNNVEFTTGAEGAGTPLYAWIESGTAPTASSTEITTAPSSSSTAAVVWVNLGSTTIPANSSITIYMNFMSSSVMTGTTGYTGEAPQLTSTYGQYDNGALVFTNFYDNFAGSSLNTAHWTVVDNTIVVNNGLTMTYSGGQNWTGMYTKTFTGGLNTLLDAYCKPSSVSPQGIDMMVNGPTGTPPNGIAFQMQANLTYGNGTCTVAPNNNYNTVSTTSTANDWYLFSAVLTNSPAAYMELNYTAASPVTGSGVGAVGSGTPVGIGVGPSNGETGTYQWFRDRVLPPNAVMPSASAGTYGHY